MFHLRESDLDAFLLLSSTGRAVADTTCSPATQLLLLRLCRLVELGVAGMELSSTVSDKKIK